MSRSDKRSHKRADSYRRRKPTPLFRNPKGLDDRQSRDAQTSRATSGTVDELMKNAVNAIQSRRFDEARSLLDEVIKLQPANAVAHNCLGIVNRAQGDIPGAIASYERALQFAPSYAEAHNNLGVAREATGNLELAAAVYEAALQWRPNFAAAMNNLGNVLTKLGRENEAVTKLTEAIRHQPTFAAAHNNLGLAYLRLHRAAQAEECFRDALTFQPAFPEANVNLGNALRAKRRYDDAISCYQAALQVRPRYPEALTGMANTLLDQSRPHEALTAYMQAIRIDETFAEAHFGQGNALLELGQLKESVASFEKAIEHRPKYADAMNNLGSTYGALGQLDKAEKYLLDALEINPDLVTAHNNLGNLYRTQDRYDLAAKSYREILRRQPDKPLNKLRISTLCPTVFNSREEMDEYAASALEEWQSLEGAATYASMSDLLSMANEPPYNLQFFAENIRPLKEAYAKVFRYTGPEFQPRKRTGKIRIGTIITKGHELAFLRLIWDSLARMNRDEFDLTIVCEAESMTKFRLVIPDGAVQLLAMSKQQDKIVHDIREQNFDIVHYFEICTDARNYFLPYFRLAPVQVTTWGIQVTSGIPNVDCYLSSEYSESPEADEHYSERLIRARTLLTYHQRLGKPETPKTRAEFGFSPGEHLYICAQHLGKFHTDYDSILADILRQDPRGRIVGTQDKHGYGAKRLRERWKRNIPDVEERITMLPRLGQSDYLSLLLAGDVLLDPLHFGGVSTTYDALSLEKPVVTLPSRLQRGRYTAGCFAKMGITSCVAQDRDDYVRLAVAIASDKDRQQQIAIEIREASWRVFEDPESVHEHERIFRELALEARRS